MKTIRKIAVLLLAFYALQVLAVHVSTCIPANTKTIPSQPDDSESNPCHGEGMMHASLPLSATPGGAIPILRLDRISEMLRARFRSV